MGQKEGDFVTVFIDADGCPVVDAAISVCRNYGVACLLLCDTAHFFQRTGADTLVFDQGADSVDYAIASRVCPGDLVITQDYGLAAMCLARHARVLHQDGWEYTAENIDALLFQRHTSRKLRRANVRLKGPKKRTHSQDQAFVRALDDLLHTTFQG